MEKNNNENVKRYDINSLDKLCNVVTPENIDRLSIDLLQWLYSYCHTIEKIREKYPKETKNKSNIKIAKGSFTWIDDGNSDFLAVTVENVEMGEITEKVFEKPNSEPTAPVS